MSNAIRPDVFIKLPSGLKVHPQRLIVKDGSFSWSAALGPHTCSDAAHEAHIIKTANRLEQLNKQVSDSLEPWQGLKPVLWYSPVTPKFEEGIAVLMTHAVRCIHHVYRELKPKIESHESLSMVGDLMLFRRC